VLTLFLLFFEVRAGTSLTVAANSKKSLLTQLKVARFLKT